MTAHATMRRRTRRLLEQVRDCRLCEASLPAGCRPVLQLDSDARVLIAGQAPGRRVHASGVPFLDASGQRLRAWMDVSCETFHDTKHIAILPMGFCYPGSGRSGDLPPRPECAPAWRAQLLECLPALELTIVLGAYALEAHWPRAGDARRGRLTECVRSWREHWPTLIALPHPSPRNQRWLRANPWFEIEVVPALRARLAELGVPLEGAGG